MSKFNKYREDLDNQIKDLNILDEDFDEAFGKGNLEKVSNLLAKVASKRLGGKFMYAWKEKFSKKSGANGIGYRYISTDGQGIRFNHVVSDNSFTVNSVDYWKKRDELLVPSMSIYFEDGINIVQLTDELFTAIQTGKVPAIDLTEMAESSASEKKQKRLDFAAQNDIKASYANTNSTMIKKAEKMGILDQYNKWMTIKTGDSDKTELGDKIEADNKYFNNGAFYADPKYVFDDIAESAKIIAKGLWRSLIIVGAPGIGKTYNVKANLNTILGGQMDGLAGKWVFKTGVRASAFGFYKTILLNKKKIVVYDDSDSIWKDQFIPNMLKSVCSDDGDRWVENGTGATVNVDLMSSQARKDEEDEYISELIEDPGTKRKPPSKFLFEGGFINISNLPGTFFSKGDAAAVASRSIFIDVHLAQKDTLRRMATIMEFDGDSPEEIAEYLNILAKDGAEAILGTGRYSPENYGEIRYMTGEEARKNKKLSMRSVNILKALKFGGAKNWEKMAMLYS